MVGEGSSTGTIAGVCAGKEILGRRLYGPGRLVGLDRNVRGLGEEGEKEQCCDEGWEK